jgi:hypothetical protein
LKFFIQTLFAICSGSAVQYPRKSTSLTHRYTIDGVSRVPKTIYTLLIQRSQAHSLTILKDLLHLLPTWASEYCTKLPFIYQNGEKYRHSLPDKVNSGPDKIVIYNLLLYLILHKYILIYCFSK